MDITTVVGLAGVAVLAFLAVATGQVSGVILNFHGLLLVLGGTAVAMLINTPFEYLFDAVRSLNVLLRGDFDTKPKTIVPVLTSLSQSVHARGINSLRDADSRVAGGFLAHAARAALEFKEPDYVRGVLEIEINQEAERNNEIVNVFRTMSVLAPMFGLIGTLIGIVGVLKEIANPEQVGPAMAVAVTTAFYGILLANLVAVPLAGKLRIRYYEDYMAKVMIIDAISQMLKGTVPVVLERRLQAYLTGKLY